MGQQQSKPKGKYLRELHQKVPEMNLDEIIQVYEDFIHQSGGKRCLTKKQFVKVYNKAFGTNGAKQLAEHIFDSFDTDGNGSVDFEEFLIGLSITETSTETPNMSSKLKKLKWAFGVYDKDKSGTIDRNEMRKIVKSVSGLLPDDLFLQGRTPRQYADDLFDKVDVDKSGDITFDEFQAAAERDPTIVELLLPAPADLND